MRGTQAIEKPLAYRRFITPEDLFERGAGARGGMPRDEPQSQARIVRRLLLPILHNDPLAQLFTLGIVRLGRLQRNVEICPALGQQRLGLVPQDGGVLIAGRSARARQKVLVELLPEILEAGPDRVRKHRHGAVPIPPQLLANEAFDLAPLIRGECIDFGQQDRDVGGKAPQVADQFDVVMRKRRIDSHRDQCQSRVWQPLRGRIRVVLEDAIEPRRVDETDTAIAVHRGHFEMDRGNLLRITGIGLAVSET